MNAERCGRRRLRAARPGTFATLATNRKATNHKEDRAVRENDNYWSKHYERPAREQSDFWTLVAAQDVAWIEKVQAASLAARDAGL